MSEENPYAAPAPDLADAPSDPSIPGPHNHASLGERLLGKIIDTLVILPVIFLIGLVFAIIFTKALSENPNTLQKLSGNSGFEIFPSIVMPLAIMVIYMAIQWTFWKATGQSIGKKVMKTRIVNLDGSQANVRTIAFKRYGPIAILSMIPVVGGLIGLVDALLVFRGERNCLHDDIAGTRVIKIQTPAV